MLRTTIYVIASLALLASSAQAWEIRESCAHSRFYGWSNCRTIGTPDLPPPSRDFAQEAEDNKARTERIKRWEDFCKPTRHYDEFGVVRLAYAQKGCEFGRGE
jgi:hypothetical protein